MLIRERESILRKGREEREYPISALRSLLRQYVSCAACLGTGYPFHTIDTTSPIFFQDPTGLYQSRIRPTPPHVDRGIAPSDGPEAL